LGLGYVRIEVRVCEDDRMCFKIVDNGVGIDDIERIKKGYGIQNVKERIRLCYGDEFDIDIKTEVGVGTEVDVVIPLQNKQYEEAENDTSRSI